MKITPAVMMASALLLAAGCAHEQNHAQYDENMSPAYSSGRMSQYNSGNTIPSQSGSGAYSARMNEDVVAGQSGNESDNTVAAGVRQSLRRNAEIAPIESNIQITANNGAVLLSGSVQSEEQKRQITGLAQQAVGVVAVNNQLQVLSTPGNNLPRLYKDAGSTPGNSTNSILNPTSLPDGSDKIYQESNPQPNQ